MKRRQSGFRELGYRTPTWFKEKAKKRLTRVKTIERRGVM